jgi:threonine synthase
LTTIKRIFEEYNYTLDPHGAVGYLAVEKYLQIHPTKKGVFLETAHPVKFPEAVEHATGKKVDIPLSILSIMKSEKKSIKMPASYQLFKNFLLD